VDQPLLDVDQRAGVPVREASACGHILLADDDEDEREQHGGNQPKAP
jgi:hypothetical protein